MERRSERLAKLLKEKPISYRETAVKRVFKKIRRKRTSVQEKQEYQTRTESCLQRVGGAISSDLDEQPCCSKYLPDQRHLLRIHAAENQKTEKAPVFSGTTVGVKMFAGPGLAFSSQRPSSVDILPVSKRGPAFGSQQLYSANVCPVSQPKVLQPKSKSGPGITEQQLVTHTARSQGSSGNAEAFSGALVGAKIPAVPVKCPSPIMKTLPLLLLLLLAFIFVSFSGFQNLSRSFSDSQYMQLLESELSRENQARQQYLKKEVDALQHEITGLQSLKDAFIDVNEEIKIQFMEVGGSGAANRYIPRKDFALKSAGASVIKSSQSYSTGAKVCMWGFCWEYSRSPNVILERDNAPGNCWAMNGSEGYVVIKLSQEICPTNVILDHISRKVSHTEEVSSAPKDFSVYGLKDGLEEQEETFLGTFSYSINGFSTQIFNLREDNLEKFKYLRIKILSNWGHPNYTCIYGIRVNGGEECVYGNRGNGEESG